MKSRRYILQIASREKVAGRLLDGDRDTEERGKKDGRRWEETNIH